MKNISCLWRKYHGDVNLHAFQRLFWVEPVAKFLSESFTSQKWVSMSPNIPPVNLEESKRLVSIVNRLDGVQPTDLDSTVYPGNFYMGILSAIINYIQSHKQQLYLRNLPTSSLIITLSNIWYFYGKVILQVHKILNQISTYTLMTILLLVYRTKV